MTRRARRRNGEPKRGGNMEWKQDKMNKKESRFGGLHNMSDECFSRGRDSISRAQLPLGTAARHVLARASSCHRYNAAA